MASSWDDRSEGAFVFPHYVNRLVKRTSRFCNQKREMSSPSPLTHMVEGNSFEKAKMMATLIAYPPGKAKKMEMNWP